MDPVNSTDHMRWSARPYSWKAAVRLSKTLGLPFAVAVVLAARGYTEPEQARRFLDCHPEIPDPFLFHHMKAVVDLITQAAAEGMRVIVHGDYDADGITATAALVHGLRAFGVEPECYLPSRFREGYGLSRTAVEHISRRRPGLLITVDCGINYPDEVALARELGLEVVVIDHHQPGPRLPDCLLIHEVAGNYPPGRLCGVGLALKVLHALHIESKHARRDQLPDELLPLLDLVAIGTVADLAPLTGENRYYVSEGLKLLTVGTRVGLRALTRVSGCAGAVDSSMVAFRIAPRLNAAGRLADPWPPLRLLLTEDEAEAERLSVELHELNGARQDVERQILEAAVRSVESEPELPPVLVLAGEDWHEGVVGIVASRLVERYRRPSILLGVRDGVAKGSGRSIAEYDLVRGLEACSEYLTVYGGHPQAVGLTLPAEHLDAFRASITQHARGLLGDSDFAPRFTADAILRGEDLILDTATGLASLEPFGLGNPRPRILLVGAGIRDAEATRDGSHLRVSVEVDGVRTRGIGFGLGARACELGSGEYRHLVGAQFRADQWQGNLRAELLVERVDKIPLLSLDAMVEPDWEFWTRADGWEPKAVAAAEAGLRGFPLPVVRDLRGRGDGVSAIAQVLATGERALIVAGSVSWWVRDLEPALALAAAGLGEVVCLTSASADGAWERAGSAKTVFTEWDVLATLPDLLEEREHLIIVGPPFRAAHLTNLPGVNGRVAVHLYYGNKGRELTERLLRCIVHPRFGMVCLYRALQAATDDPAPMLPRGGPQIPLLRKAARLGWEERRVVLSKGSLRRAWDILGEAGKGQALRGEGKLEPQLVATYREAETEYQECLELCRSM